MPSYNFAHQAVQYETDGSTFWPLNARPTIEEIVQAACAEMVRLASERDSLRSLNETVGKEKDRAIGRWAAEVDRREGADRENRDKCLELAEMAGSRDGAARELLFLAGVEEISCLSRGGEGCIFRALQHLRPDITTLWAEGEDPFALLHRFFPEDGD